MEGVMTLRPFLAAVAFTTLLVAGTAASACPWSSASAGDDQSNQVASAGQGTQQTPPAKTN